MSATIKELAEKCGVSVVSIHKYLNANGLKDSLEKSGKSFLIPDEITADILRHYGEKSKAEEAVEDNMKLRAKIKELEEALKETKEEKAILLETMKTNNGLIESNQKTIDNLVENNSNLAKQIETLTADKETLSKALLDLTGTNKANAFLEASKEATEAQEKQEKKPWYKRIFG